MRISLTDDRAFAAQATAKVLTTVQTMGSQYNALIEEDQVISIADGIHRY